jgi:hypothetical protein
VRSATLSAVAFSMASCVPHTDTAASLLAFAPLAAAFAGIVHVAVTVIVSGVAAVLGWLIRSSLT